MNIYWHRVMKLLAKIGLTLLTVFVVAEILLGHPVGTSIGSGYLENSESRVALRGFSAECDGLRIDITVQKEYATNLLSNLTGVDIFSGTNRSKWISLRGVSPVRTGSVHVTYFVEGREQVRELSQKLGDSGDVALSFVGQTFVPSNLEVGISVRNHLHYLLRRISVGDKRE